MAVRQRGSTWQVDVTYKGERAPRVSFPTKAEAEAVAADFRAALIRGETITPSVSARRGRIDDQQNNLCNLGALFDHTFRLYWQGTKGERTARINGQAWVETLGERCDVRTLTSADISRVCDEWSDRGSAPGTINRKMAALGKMLGVAEADQIIPRKPLLPKRKEYAGRLRYYSREEEEHMLAYFRTTGETELAYLVTLAMDTGLRAGELRALQVRDYVPQTNLLHVWASKSDAPRSVPLTSRARHAWDTLALGRVASGVVFQDHLTPSHVSRMFRKWRTAYGIEVDTDAVFHACRHTCCSRLIQAGIHLVTVQKWMGHKTIETTMRYAHLGPDAFTDAVAALNERHAQQ